MPAGKQAGTKRNYENGEDGEDGEEYIKRGNEETE